ncbi:MAG: hypothetical protein AAGK04_02590 [Planctomycetota bacterium]
MPPAALTWATLLARWTDLARAAVSLPHDGEGGRWREAVAPIIGLQAITSALRELHALPDDERSLGLDRAEMQIRSDAATLHEIWRGEPLPEALVEILDDARDALVEAKERGIEWWVLGQPIEVGDPSQAVDAVLERGFSGDLWLARPGTRLQAESMAAYVRSRGVEPEVVGRLLIDLFGAEGEARTTLRHRQVYRAPAVDLGEGWRDVIAAMDETLPAGAPVLEPWIDAGVRVGRFDASAARAWSAAQVGSA